MGTITEDLKDVSIETYGAKYDWELISKSKELSRRMKRGRATDARMQTAGSEGELYCMISVHMFDDLMGPR